MREFLDAEPTGANSIRGLPLLYNASNLL